MKLGLLAVVAVALLALVFALAPRARASAGIRVLGEPGVENRFPDGIVFSIDAESDAEIREIRLRYTFVPDNRPATTRAEFDPGAKVRASFNLRSGSRQLYIPPGKDIRYSWEIRDAAGNELTTEERLTSFADTRFKWQQVTDGHVNLFYYRGTPRDAEVMAQVANETIVKASALLGTDFEFPIKMWAYASQRDFQIALAHSSVSSDPGVLGQAHSPDTFIMVVDRLSSPSALDTARHELTHLVTNQALQGGPYKDLYPSWLNEGTSVYLQVSPNDVGYIDSLEKAIRDDTVIPLRSLASGGRIGGIGLFYGQSYAVVKHLIDTYGSDKFAVMIDEFKASGDLDATLTKTYGVDRDRLYRDWRISVGLKAEPAAGPDPGAPPSEQAAREDGSDSATVALVIGGTLVLLLLAAAAVVGGLLLARRAQAARGE